VELLGVFEMTHKTKKSFGAIATLHDIRARITNSSEIIVLEYESIGEQCESFRIKIRSSLGISKRFELFAFQTFFADPRFSCSSLLNIHLLILFESDISPSKTPAFLVFMVPGILCRCQFTSPHLHRKNRAVVARYTTEPMIISVTV